MRALVGHLVLLKGAPSVSQSGEKFLLLLEASGVGLLRETGRPGMLTAVLQTRWCESAKATYLPFGGACGDLSSFLPSFLSSGCMAAFRSGEGDGFWGGAWGLLGELVVCVMRDSNR